MSNFNKIVLTFGILFIGYILFATLSKQEVKINETETVKGKLISIKRDKKNSKIYYNSYTITLKEYSNTFKIIPEYKHCFKYNDFVNEVKPNDEIEVRIDKDEKALLDGIKSIVAIKVNSKSYIDLNCVNKSIEQNKIQLPLILFGLVILLWFVIYIQKRLGIKIK